MTHRSEIANQSPGGTFGDDMLMCGDRVAGTRKRDAFSDLLKSSQAGSTLKKDSMLS